jgi:hypothetical protein
MECPANESVRQFPSVSNFPAPVEKMGRVQKLTPRYLAEQAR